MKKTYVDEINNWIMNRLSLWLSLWNVNFKATPHDAPCELARSAHNDDDDSYFYFGLWPKPPLHIHILTMIHHINFPDLNIAIDANEPLYCRPRDYRHRPGHQLLSKAHTFRLFVMVHLELPVLNTEYRNSIRRGGKIDIAFAFF